MSVINLSSRQCILALEVQRVALESNEADVISALARCRIGLFVCKQLEHLKACKHFICPYYNGDYFSYATVLKANTPFLTIYKDHCTYMNAGLSFALSFKLQCFL